MSACEIDETVQGFYCAQMFIEIKTFVHYNKPLTGIIKNDSFYIQTCFCCLTLNLLIEMKAYEYFYASTT